MALAWDNLQSLERLSSRLDVLLAVLTVLIAILGVLRVWPLARRVSELKAAESAALAERLATAEAGAEAARKTLRSFRAEAKITVRGDWSSPHRLGRQDILTLPREDEYIVLRGLAPSQVARFFPTYVARFNESDGSVRIVFQAAVRDGDWPLGENSDVLKGLRPVAVALPMITATDTKSGKGVIHRLELQLFADGQLTYSFMQDLDVPANFPTAGWWRYTTNLPPIE